MRQPLKAEVNGLTVTCSPGLTLASYTRGISHVCRGGTTVSAGRLNELSCGLFVSGIFGGVYPSQGYKVDTWALITLPHPDVFILRWWWRAVVVTQLKFQLCINITVSKEQNQQIQVKPIC